MLKKLLFICTLLLSVVNSYAQNKVGIDAEHGKLLYQNDDKKSNLVKLTVVLPEKNY